MALSVGWGGHRATFIQPLYMKSHTVEISNRLVSFGVHHSVLLSVYHLPVQCLWISLNFGFEFYPIPIKWVFVLNNRKMTNNNHPRFEGNVYTIYSTTYYLLISYDLYGECVMKFVIVCSLCRASSLFYGNKICATLWSQCKAHIKMYL